MVNIEMTSDIYPTVLSQMETYHVVGPEYATLHDLSLLEQVEQEDVKVTRMRVIQIVILLTAFALLTVVIVWWPLIVSAIADSLFNIKQ